MNKYVPAVMIIEAGWLIAGIVWLSNYYVECAIENAKETVLGKFFPILDLPKRKPFRNI